MNNYKVIDVNKWHNWCDVFTIPFLNLTGSCCSELKAESLHTSICVALWRRSSLSGARPSSYPVTAGTAPTRRHPNPPWPWTEWMENGSMRAEVLFIFQLVQNLHNNALFYWPSVSPMRIEKWNVPVRVTLHPPTTTTLTLFLAWSALNRFDEIWGKLMDGMEKMLF